MTLGAEFAGLGGTVRSVRPIVQYKKFIPVQNRRNTIGYNVQGSFISGYGGLVAPPFQRFFMGGENDIRGFDIRSISPVAFLPSSNVITLTNPDGTPVPKNPANPRLGNWTVPIPVDQIVFPGGDLSVLTNLEYRITIAGPVAIAPFVDAGIDPVIRPSQLQIATVQYDQVIGTPFRMSDAGCWLQLPGRTNARSDRHGAFPESAGSGLHQLEAAHVHRTRTANVPAGGERAIPHLLGIQPAAAGRAGQPADSDHARHVPGGSGWRLHLSSGGEYVMPPVSC